MRARPHAGFSRRAPAPAARVVSLAGGGKPRPYHANRYRAASGHDALYRNQARSIRDPFSFGRRRDGGGLQGERHAARAHGRGQGPAGAPVVFRRGAAALRARGEDDLAALAPAHLRAARRRPRGRDRLPRHGVPRRGDAVGSPREGTAAARADVPLRPGDRRRSGQGAPAGDRAPGSEAGKRHVDEVRGQAARLRSGQGDGAGAVEGQPDGAADAAGSHAGRHDPRDVPVHGAGTARGQGGRRADGHLRVRRDPLRDGDGEEGVHGRRARRR